MEDRNYCLSVFISDNKKAIDKYKDKLERKLTLEIFSDVDDSIAYLVKENLNICFCMIDLSSFDERKVFPFIDKVHKVNNLIKIILIETSLDFQKNYKSEIDKYDAICYDNKMNTDKLLEEVFELLSKCKEAKRKYSRVNWPLNVNVAFLSDKLKTRIDRHILSISGNGAYICTDDRIPAKGERLNLNITFKDFKLMTEAIVVWTNEDGKRNEYPCGFAVSFVDIGHISQKIIDDIIKDKLLQEILIEMKDV